MILELDCGNTLIKWRVLDAHQVRATGLVETDEALVPALQEYHACVHACRLVSVRSDDETQVLVRLLKAAWPIEVHVAQPAEFLAGVRNGYNEYQRLGLDRWLAVVAGYRLAGGACLVLDLGTAVTSDFVDAAGQHLGGFICPGMPLMRSQLRQHTRRIRYAEDEVSGLAQALPGRNTADAVERGCALMLRSFAQAQVALAGEYFAGDFVVLLTGGDGLLVKDLLPDARWVPDLVFAGLAQACPLS